MGHASELNVISVSGGKDSTALYCLAIEFYGNNFLPLFADTGNEHPVTGNYVRNLHVIAGGPVVRIVKSDFKFKLKDKTATGNPFLDMMIWKGRAPSTKAQFCTEWVKLWPIRLFLETNYPDREWIMHIGLRAGESLSRSRRQPFEWNDYFDCESISPLLYESEEGIFRFLAGKGVPP
jgi:3'-phosphoadenosine 5'-phosphosulfate sulfotransferase (PAPS reductase)/FAD synthetase